MTRLDFIQRNKVHEKRVSQSGIPPTILPSSKVCKIFSSDEQGYDLHQVTSRNSAFKKFRAGFAGVFE